SRRTIRLTRAARRRHRLERVVAKRLRGAVIRERERKFRFVGASSISRGQARTDGAPSRGAFQASGRGAALAPHIGQGGATSKKSESLFQGDAASVESPEAQRRELALVAGASHRGRAVAAPLHVEAPPFVGGCSSVGES